MRADFSENVYEEAWKKEGGGGGGEEEGKAECTHSLRIQSTVASAGCGTTRICCRRDALVKVYIYMSVC